MKVGITERGDASLDMSWVDKLYKTAGCAILITKNISVAFAKTVLEEMANGRQLIVHATCTGHGGTKIEPGVFKYTYQLDGLKWLIDHGFPRENCVLRIDPIIPDMLDAPKAVLDYALQIGLLPDMRVRVSVMDMYPHARDRFIDRGIPLTMTGFQATPKQFADIDALLASYPQVHFESCAEPNLTVPEKCGCISLKDLQIFGDTETPAGINPQNRNGCLCLAGKTELLEKRGQCAHRCAYCYWKGNY